MHVAIGDERSKGPKDLRLLNGLTLNNTRSGQYTSNLGPIASSAGKLRVQRLNGKQCSATKWAFSVEPAHLQETLRPMVKQGRASC